MNRKVKLRTLLIGGLFTLFFIVLIGKIYWVQVVDAKELLKKAQVMWERNKILQPVRGSIVDRYNQVLAEDGASYTVIVNPTAIEKLKNAQTVVKVLSEILNKPENELMDMVTKRNKEGDLSSWVEVRSEGWKIDAETADRIAKALNLSEPINKQANLYTHGVYLEESQKRYYPAGSMASHVLGYFDKNGKAVMGLEAAYNELLTGKPGYINTTKDRMGYELPDAKASYEPAEDGKTLQLTIDRNIQSYIETAMEKSYNEWKPKSMTVVAMNPKTGEILGMANMPTFNPSKYWESETKNFYNHAVASQYEPGSTFKLVTLAGAVEEGLFDPNDKFQSGGIAIYDRTLKDHNLKGWGKISYMEGLKRSSNVAFVKLGYEKLKPDKLKEYIARFGFGVKTGIDIPGETKGLVRFGSPVDYATATFGQGGVLVTAIQQIAAYSAIANGGMMMQPHIVKAVLDPKTNEPVQTFPPKEIRQVVTPQTAAKVTEYLEQVVSDQEIGTGRNAYIEGYRVAGKTGTAQKVINGKYSTEKWLITFVGYAPVEDPKIAVLVLADEPELHGNYHNGGLVAPPVFKEIVTQSLRYMNVSATVKQELSGVDKKVVAPQVEGKPLIEAKKDLGDNKIKYDVLGKGTSVVAQFPEGGTEIGPTQRIYLVTEEKAGMDLPNLQGKSLRDALAVCSFLKVNCQVTGEGYVASQTISAGEDGQQVAVLQLVPWIDLEKAKAEAAKVASKTDTSTKPPASNSAKSSDQKQKTDKKQ